MDEDMMRRRIAAKIERMDMRQLRLILAFIDGLGRRK